MILLRDSPRPGVVAFLWRWGPPLAEAVALFALSHQPKLPDTPGGDKLAHVVAYLVLGFFVARALALGARSRSSRAVVLGGAALAALHGVFDEMHQSFVPGRDASVDDLVADGIGAILGALAFAALVRWRASRRA
ncbi:VanZ family protein [Myxococcota bacterium]|nr:VanZ family protein [Myxococcota bacterium]